MATHSSVLAWRIPGPGEPGGLPAVYGVALSQTRLKQLSSSSNSPKRSLIDTARGQQNAARSTHFSRIFPLSYLLLFRPVLFQACMTRAPRPTPCPTTTFITTGTTQKEKGLRGGGTWFPFPQALGILRDTSQAREGGRWARGLKQVRRQTGEYRKPAQGAPCGSSLVVKTVSSGVRLGGSDTGSKAITSLCS